MGRRPDLPAVLDRAREVSRKRVWTLLAKRRLQAPPVPPEEGVGWLARELYGRTVDEYDAVVAITGEEGSSKSTLAFRLIMELSAVSGVPWHFEDLCYTGDDVLAAYERAERSGAIWYDEGVRGLLAGETFNREQTKLIKALTLVRETGAVLFVCVPDIFMLAKKVRGRRATFWVHVTGRGTKRNPGPSRAIVHERDARLRYLPTVALGLARSLRCPDLLYDPFPPGDVEWARYQAAKRTKLGEFFEEERGVGRPAD